MLFSPKCGSDADAFLVVVLERAAERVADEPSRDAVAQRDADRARVRHRRLERLERELQQRPPRRRAARRADTAPRRRSAPAPPRESAACSASKFAGVRSTISTVSSGIASVPTRIFGAGGASGGHAAADEILDRQAQNRQGLVDRGRLGVVARIEAHAALAGRQQHQTAPERAVAQRVAPVGAHDVEAQHDAGAAHVLQDLAVARAPAPRARLAPARRSAAPDRDRACPAARAAAPCRPSRLPTSC